MKRKLNWLILVISRQSVAYGVAALIIGGFMWYRLGTLVPGFSQPELAARAAASSLRHLTENPLFLPHKIVQYLLIKLGQSGAFWMRLPSTGFAILTLIAFYRILLTWYSRRLAILCAFLFLSSAWFLHFARLATPEILYATFSLGLVWVGIHLRSNSRRSPALIYGVIIAIASLYIPGLVWLVGPAIVWQHRLIRHEVQELPKKLQLSLIMLTIIGIAPLIYGLSQDLGLVRSWLAIPATIDKSNLIYNLWHLPIWLVLAGPVSPVYWLGHVALLDGFSVVMFTLGLYLYRFYWRLDRVRAIALIMFVGAMLTVLNGPVRFFMLMPIIYLIVASGIAMLLQQWFTIFPRNPLSRWVGLGMISIVVITAGYYNYSHYFVAWPKTPATQAVFQAK